MRFNRRQFIKTAGVASTISIAGLAGCSGNDSDGDDSNDNGGTGGSTGDNEPTTIKLGHGLSAEEPLWTMDAMPEILDHVGDAYETEFVQFDANTSRLQAFQAGEIQAGTMTAISTFFAVGRGLPLTITASISQVTGDKYATRFVSQANSEFDLSEGGLEGMTIGICAFQSSCHMWAATAAQNFDLVPEDDVSLVVVPFPTMPDAVAEGRVDAATMDMPFDIIAMEEYDAETTFDAVDVMGYDHDLLELWFSTQFINKNEETVRRFLEDYNTASEYYNNNIEEVKGAILDAGFVQTPEEVYLNLPERSTQATPLTDSLDNLNQRAVELSWIDEQVDTNLLYDLSYLPE